jgi:HK97 family phage major capsid protein
MKKTFALIGAVLCACALFAFPAPALAATAVHTLTMVQHVGHFDILSSMQHAGAILAMLGAAPAFEQKDGLADNLPADPAEAIGKIAEAWDAFTKSHAEEMKEVKKGVTDPVLTERLGKIEKSLEDGSEAKQKIEAAIAAERKEREDLELRLQREGIKGDGDGAKRELEIKTFNRMLAADAAERKHQPVVLDAKGYDDYKAAFDRMLRSNEKLLTPEEMKTLSVGSDPDGGYLVTPDTSGRVAKKVFETSPIRQIASVQVISTDALEGMEDVGDAGCGYAGEHSTSGDTTTPQIGKWRIPVHIIDTEPKATQQLLDDAAIDVESWLGGKVGNKFGRFENAEFVTGAANKILGFAAGYTMTLDSGAGVSWGEIGYVATGVNGDFAASNPADKLHELVGALKVDYLPNARFVTRRTVVTKMRKFKDANGLYLLQPSLVLGVPDAVMGYPLLRAEDMPALGNSSKSLAFGDFNEAYQIVDRQGIRVLRDPYTAKPYVKFYTTKRTGGGVVNYEAMKLLSFG